MKKKLMRKVELLWICFCICFVFGCFKQEETIQYPSKEMPLLNCEYQYLIDLDTRQVLYDVKSEDRMYPASLTKMMTAIIALEECEDLYEPVEFTSEMLDGLIEDCATRAGFAVGDKPLMIDYVYASLLPSGADGCRAIAYTLYGSDEAFVERMNEKAKEIGMNHTHFTNTTGIHNDELYSTCKDMAILLEYCLNNEMFKEIISTRFHKSIPVDEYPEGLGMTNFVLMYINEEEPKYENFIIDGFLGGKGGYTIEAEHTLASHANVNGMHLLLISAKGIGEKPYDPSSIEDSSLLYNYYQENYERRTILKKDEVVGKIRINNTTHQMVDVVSDQDIELDVGKGLNSHLEFEIEEEMNAPIEQGTVVGHAILYDFDQPYLTFDLKISETKEKTRLGVIETNLFNVIENHGLSCTLLVVILLIVWLIKARNLRNK